MEVFSGADSEIQQIFSHSFPKRPFLGKFGPETQNCFVLNGTRYQGVFKWDFKFSCKGIETLHYIILLVNSINYCFIFYFIIHGYSNWVGLRGARSTRKWQGIVFEGSYKIEINFWTLDVSWTVSYETTLVHLSIYPSVRHKFFSRLDH